MKMFLAGLESSYKWLPIEKSKYTLASYAYIKQGLAEHIPKFDMFLLDSGAFTFRKKSTNVDWNQYLDKYIKFINDNDVKYFFELDIDNIIGYDNVVTLRNKLEYETGKKTIPVWHISRGIDNFKEMCMQYDYAALGSSTKYKEKDNHKLLYYLLSIAKKHNCKIHGLGFTPKIMKQFDFYSVDSTTWDGYKYGNLHKFVGNDIKTIKIPKGKGLTRDYKKVTHNNFVEYCKYQRYLDRGRF